MHTNAYLILLAAASHALAGLAEPAASAPASPPLRMPEALGRALEHHPELTALDHARQVMDARVVTAGAIPNPELSVELEDAFGTGPFSGVDESQLTLGILQWIELWGRRDRRRAAAEPGRRIAELDYEAARLEIIAVTASRFMDALAAQEEVSLQEEAVALAAGFRDTTEQRRDAGASSGLDMIQADLGFRTAQLDLDLARRRAKETARRLAAQWGAIDLDAPFLAGDLHTPLPLPELSTLLEDLRDHPHIARQWAEQEQLGARLALERLGTRPDLAVEAGYRWLNGPGEHAMVLGLSLPLPLINRNRGAILEAEASLDQSRALEEAALRSLRAQMTQVWSRLESARHELGAIDNTLLPLARQAHQESLRFLEQGRFSTLQVLAAQRELFALRLRALRAGVAGHQARLDIEALLGSIPAPAPAPSTPAPTQP